MYGHYEGANQQMTSSFLNGLRTTAWLPTQQGLLPPQQVFILEPEVAKISFSLAYSSFIDQGEAFGNSLAVPSISIPKEIHAIMKLNFNATTEQIYSRIQILLKAPQINFLEQLYLLLVVNECIHAFTGLDTRCCTIKSIRSRRYKRNFLCTI